MKGYTLAVLHAKRAFLSEQISNADNSTRELFRVGRDFFEPRATQRVQVPSKEKAQEFALFYKENIDNIYLELASTREK